MTEIRTEALTHVYREGSVRALDGVSIQIAAGERVAIVGQNGSGKSTLVRHFNGLLRPTSGQVFVNGLDASTLTVAKLAQWVGLVFQDPGRQIFSRSVRMEVEFGPRNLRRSRAELRAAVDDALAETGLTDAADANPYDLGYSRRKLLALASVLAMRTPVLILDEPTTGQDARGVERVQAIVASLSAAGRTVLAVSHDMRFVAESFERVIALRAGRVVLDGSPEVVFAEPSWPTLASTFLEPPVAARVGASVGLGSTPTAAALVDAIRRRNDAAGAAGGPTGA